MVSMREESGGRDLASTAILAGGALADLASREQLQWIDLGLDADVESGPQAIRGISIALVLSSVIWLALGLGLWKLFA
jgi:hypothetical protein